jgi:hypothetical protein
VDVGKLSKDQYYKICFAALTQNDNLLELVNKDLITDNDKQINELFKINNPEKNYNIRYNKI